MNLKSLLLVIAMCFCAPAFSQDSETESGSESFSKGIKSHNGKKQALTPEELAQKKADREALRAAKANLKKDGKLSKDDRKKLRAMKKSARKKFNSASSSSSSAPASKDTQQMIDDADGEPETETEADESADPQMQDSAPE